MMFVLITQGCLSLILATGILSLAAGFFICQRLNRSNSNDLNIDGNLLTTNDALEMIHRYVPPAGDNTSSGFIDIDVLLVYIDYVRTKCDEVGKSLTGLEYYFAKYDGDLNENDNSGRSTIIFFPTYQGTDEDGETGNIPFDPFNEGNPVHVRAASNAVRAKNSGQTARSAQSNTDFSGKCALNKSNMSPPKKPVTI